MNLQFNRALDTLAAQAAGRYKSRCWWASFADLKQTAWLTLIEAAQHYDPQTGVPFVGYAWRAAINQLHAVILRESAPVTAPGHNFSALRGIYRAPLDDGLVDAGANPHATAVAREEHARLKAVLDEVLSGERDHEIARDVLLHEMKPREVAAKRRVPVERVYRVVRRVKRNIGSSYACWLLWKEGEP